VEIAYKDIGLMMLTILVNYVTTPVKLVLDQLNVNVLYVTSVTTYTILVA